jgi:hypothetical protein
MWRKLLFDGPGEWLSWLRTLMMIRRLPESGLRRLPEGGRRMV